MSKIQGRCAWQTVVDIFFLICYLCGHVNTAILLVEVPGIKRNKLPAYSVSIEIYSGIARLPCDSTPFLFTSLQ